MIFKLEKIENFQAILTEVADITKDWDQTNRGLTGAGQAVIAVAAVAVAVGTGGIGSGISGAMMTAAATTAGTTATISATNASMNTDSSIGGSTRSISSNAWRDTASDESLRNIAISAVVAGAASWGVEVSGGSTSLEQGKEAVYKPDPERMAKNPQYRAFVETNYPNYNGVIDPSANNIGLANRATTVDMIGQPVDYSKMTPLQKVVNEGGIISNTANQAGGMNAMSVSHDGWGQNFIVGKAPILQVSIIPAIAIEYCAISPAACAAVTSKLMNNDFGTKK